MGNNQSQASDEEDTPNYNYHEQVLLEAENASTNIIDPGDVASDDEQYFSAEEGDSVRSVTPPRTRPESSSGEDFSDSENNSEEDEEEQETTGAVQESPDSGNTRLRTNLRSQRSCGQCNVSTFQEHDSIAPEIETAGRRSSNSFVSSANTTRHSGDHSLITRSTATSRSFSNQTATNQRNSNINASPFVPIQPAQNANRETSPISGKRKISRGSQSPRGDYVLPKKRLATRATSKRQRLGYFESSESASERENDSEKKTPVKQAKFSKSSPKKSRRSDHHEYSNSDSDEKRYRKTRRTRRSRRDDESDSDESSKERNSARGRGSHKDQGDYRSPRKGRRRKSSENSTSENSDDSQAGRRKRRKSRRQNSESDEEMNKGRKIPQENKHQRNVENDNIEHVNTQNQQRKNTNQAVNLTETNSSTVPCHTLKMGEHGVRNAHGKVFPLRQQDLGSVETQQPPTANLSNPKNSAFKAPNSMAPKRKVAVLQEVDDSGDNLHVSQIQVLKTTQSSVNSVQALRGNNLSQENKSLSPLRNVVLTPSKSPHTGSYERQQMPDSDTQLTGSGENSMEMEVDDADASMDFQTDPPSQVQTVGIRSFLKGRRRGKTATERLKNFWSEKKQNISSNLKSFFSKTSSPTVNSINSSDPSWQSLVSNFSNNSSHSLSPRNRGSSWPQSASSVTYLSSEGLGGPTFTSSPQNQPFTHQIQPGIRVPSSLSNSNLSPIFSSVPPQSYQGGRFKDDINQSLEQSNGRLSNSRILRSGNHASVGPSPVRVSPRLRAGTPRGQQPKQMPVLSPQRNNTNPSVEHLPQTSQFQVLNCRLGGRLQLSVSMGDISDQSTAGIVNWTDGALTHQVTECSRHIAAKAGALLRAGCNDYIENKGSHLEAPDVLTTPAGGRFDQGVEAILHVVAPHWLDGDEASNNHNLMEVYTNCMRFAEERLGLESVSLPLIANGMFPSDLCVQAFFDALLVFIAEHAASTRDLDLSSVQLVISDPATTDLAADMIQSRLDSIISGGLDNVVGAIFNSYLSATHHNNADVDRAISGRPRVKRPRL